MLDPTFWECPPPMVKHKVNIIINLSINKLQGIAMVASSTYSLITLGKYINARGRRVIYNNIAS